MDLQTTAQKVWDFIKRHSVYCILGLISVVGLGIAPEVISTVLLIITAECLALALSSLALWSYTSIKYNNLLIAGGDGKIDSVERNGLTRVIAAVFTGVHVLVGLVIVAVYIVQYSK